MQYPHLENSSFNLFQDFLDKLDGHEKITSSWNVKSSKVGP